MILFTCRKFATYALACAWLCSLGCGGAEVDKYELHGKVIYQGAPVPRGEITLEPDASAGNTGPGTTVRIENGEYNTEGGMGAVGGPHIVRINGFDGVADGDNADGKQLFPPYEAKVDLPKQSGEKDFNIE